MRFIAIVIAVGIIALALPCWAGGGKGYVNDTDAAADNANVKFAIHFVTYATKTCSKLPAISSREQIVTRWNSTGDVDAFFVIFDYDSLLNYEYALTWPAEWGSCSTVICAKDLSLGGVVNPGDALSASFFDCQRPIRLGGSRPNYWPVVKHWFAPTGSGEIGIIRSSTTGMFGTVGCWPPSNPIHAEPETVYYGGILMDPYVGPPPGNATLPTTWGAVKALFK
jgi:hypothetical protein